MQYARTVDAALDDAIRATDGRLVEAERGVQAVCPGCRSPVIAKCGDLVVHHWAHEVGDDCDRWSEPESPWHRRWKSYAAPERREVVIGDHRADIQRSNGVVVELQHSSISAAEIAEREAHYKRMVWLFDARGLAFDEDGEWRSAWQRSGLILRRHLARRGQDCWSFRWKMARKTIAACTKPTYLDLGRGKIFALRLFDVDGGPPYGGWGELRRTLDLVHWISEGRITSIKFANGEQRIGDDGRAFFQAHDESEAAA